MISASEAPMKLNPIHAGQVALASSLALSVRHTPGNAGGNQAQGRKGQMQSRSLGQRLVRWLIASALTHS